MFKYGRLGSRHVKEALDNFNITLSSENRYYNYGAFFQNHLVGLISVYDKGPRYEIEYLSILPLFREQGAGSALLNLIAYSLFDKNIVGYFNSRDHDHNRLRTFMKKNGWSTRAYYNQLEVPLYDVPAFFSKRNLTQLEQYLSAFEIQFVPDDQLTPIDINTINKIMEFKPQFLNPLDIGPDDISGLSFYVRYNQDIVGWVKVLRGSPDYLELKCIYISPNFRQHNLFILMLEYIIQKAISMGLGKMHFIFCNNPFNVRINKIHAFYFKKAYNNKITFFKVVKYGKLSVK